MAPIERSSDDLIRETLDDCRTFVSGPAWLRQKIEDALNAVPSLGTGDNLAFEAGRAQGFQEGVREQMERSYGA